MPIFPPFLNGQTRSMTLMPVSKSSVSVVRGLDEAVDAFRKGFLA